jgi:hypothetical protein
MAEDTCERLRSPLRKFDHAMLVSHTRDGETYARPMAVTSLRSPKVGAIGLDADVLVTVQIDQHAKVKL